MAYMVTKRGDMERSPKNSLNFIVCGSKQCNSNWAIMKQAFEGPPEEIYYGMAKKQRPCIFVHLNTPAHLDDFREPPKGTTVMFDLRMYSSLPIKSRLPIHLVYFVAR
jgi:hypothetical protein